MSDLPREPQGPTCAGAHGADAHLLELVYDDLRRAAQIFMARERADHTLSATALVHEACLRLLGPRDVSWQNRAHIYAAAAQAMRRILVDHARARAAESRSGAPRTVSAAAARRAALELEELPDLSDERESAGFLILDEALARLEKVDEQAAEVVRLRFFAGVSVQETAEALGVSEPTIKRRWAFARSWLKVAIEAEGLE